jgi:Skp family chaperone for outer membrane proteins
VSKKGLLAGILSVAVLSIVAGFVLQPVQAQQQSARPFVHVINVNDTFKNYAKYQQLTNAFKAEVEKKENQLKAHEQVLKSKMEELKFKKDKDDRARLEKEIADKRFEVEQLKRDYQDELTKKEADIYGTCYKDMTDLVTEYCQKYQIPIVLRLQGAPDSTNPATVLQNLQRIVVYHNPNLDLTTIITDGLNANFKLASGKAGSVDR